MFWNQKDLPQPPISCFQATNRDLDLNKFRKALDDGIRQVQDSTLLKSELAILQRILYRMKMKFRSARDFKLLEKIKHCLTLYFDTNIGVHLKNIVDLVPTRYETDTYLPTKNMLYYILVRLQGLVKLMARTYDTCTLAASELNGRFRIGHFWKLFVILFALVSRLAILIKFNTKFLCKLYGKLLPHAQKLKNVGNNWLPPDYDLPSDLRTWLSVQWVYEEDFVDLTFEPSNEVVDFFNLVDDEDDDVQFCDEYILLDEDKDIIRDFHQLRPLKESLGPNRLRGFSINEDEIGEVIQLEGSILDRQQEVVEFNESELEDVGEEIIITEEQDEDVGEEIMISEEQDDDVGEEIIITEEENGNADSDTEKLKHHAITCHEDAIIINEPMDSELSGSEVTEVSLKDLQKKQKKKKSKKKKTKLLHEFNSEGKFGKIKLLEQHKKLLKIQKNQLIENSVCFLTNSDSPADQKKKKLKNKARKKLQKKTPLKAKFKYRMKKKNKLETSSYLSLDSDVHIVKSNTLSSKKSKRRKSVKKNRNSSLNF